MPSLRQRYDATPDAVTRARRDVAAFAAAAGADEGQVRDVRLAVSEAVTNAVLHGYRGAPGDVIVFAEAGGGGLSIVVHDGGAGMGPRPLRPGLGCGLELIATVAEELHVCARPHGGTELSMRFAPPAAQPLTAAAAAVSASSVAA